MFSQFGEASQQFFFEPLEVSLQDVFSVRDALLSCDTRKLMGAVVYDQLCWNLPAEALEGPCGDAILHKIESTLNLIRFFPSAPLECAESVVIPWEYFEAGEKTGVLRRRIGAVLADLDRMSQSSCDSRIYSLCEEGVESLRELPWQRILDYAIWLPYSLCEYERYAVLANVLCAMTRTELPKRKGFGMAEGKDERVAQALSLGRWASFVEAVLVLAGATKEAAQ